MRSHTCGWDLLKAFLQSVFSLPDALITHAPDSSSDFFDLYSIFVLRHDVPKQATMTASAPALDPPTSLMFMQAAATGVLPQVTTVLTITPWIWVRR